MQGEDIQREVGFRFARKGCVYGAGCLATKINLGRHGIEKTFRRRFGPNDRALRRPGRACGNVEQASATDCERATMGGFLSRSGMEPRSLWRLRLYRHALSERSLSRGRPRLGPAGLPETT